MLAHLGALLAPLRPGRHDERGMPAGAEVAVDRGDHHVDVGDPAIGRPRLLAVDHPLVIGLVVFGGADRRHVGAGVGFRRAEGRHLGVVGGPEALPDPFRHLLGRALTEDGGDGQRRAHDRHPDPRVAPEELLVDDRQHQPGLVEPELRQALVAVQPDLRRLGDHGPGGLLALVPLGGGGGTTSAAKPCTHSRTSFWSWVSSSENSGVECPGQGLLDQLLAGGGVHVAELLGRIRHLLM